MEEFMTFLGGLVAMLPGAGTAPPPSWNGYVEASYVYVAPTSGGRLETVVAQEGARVEPGAVLFILDSAQQQAAVRAAEARVAAARANAENLASGSRSEEVDVIRASLAKAEADLALARSQSERSAKLLEEGIVPEAKADADRASFAAATAQVAQLQAQLKVAELPARDPQRVAAEATLAAAEADAEQARELLSDRTVTAPVAARVERVYFDGGEMATTGTPVVSLLPAGALKVKFYVPEAERAAFSIGEKLEVGCDGCSETVEAKLSYLSADPQFTPPVIYSRDERNRLTFLAEATLEEGAVLPPGQPVTVRK